MAAVIEANLVLVSEEALPKGPYSCAIFPFPTPATIQSPKPAGGLLLGRGSGALVFGADICTGDALDAQPTGNDRLAGFFRDVQKTYMSVAERAEKILGDEGDVSPDQSG
jgi:hypothetical protein